MAKAEDKTLRRGEKNHVSRFTFQGSISVVLPAYNEEEIANWLKDADKGIKRAMRLREVAEDTLKDIHQTADKRI